MSYESVNTLPRSTRLSDVDDLLRLLGFKKHDARRDRRQMVLAEYWWFEEREYRSYAGVWCEIRNTRSGGKIEVYTRSVMAASYWDVKQQNRTMRLLRKFFGGTFVSDAGKNRCDREVGPPPAPAESGCHLAFERFGYNLHLVRAYLDSRLFKGDRLRFAEIPGMERYDPRVLSNNLILPFVVSTMEDYFRSAYVALLRFSPKRDAVFRGARLTGEGLLSISKGERTVEAAVAETWSFQNVSSLCEHFRSLDPHLDFARELRRPYLRRKRSLFESLAALVSQRHDLVHRAHLTVSLDAGTLEDVLDEVEQAVTRCHTRICDEHGWTMDVGWSQGLFGPRHRQWMRQVAKRYGNARRTSSDGVGPHPDESVGG